MSFYKFSAKLANWFMRYRNFSMIQRWPPSTIFNFVIIKFLVSHHVERDEMHYGIKFHENCSNKCRDIAFNVFQNGGRPPALVFKSIF